MRLLAFVFAFVSCGLIVACSSQSEASPLPSREVVQLNTEKRVLLQQLRDEQKFLPHDFPPLGYTGIATPEEGLVAKAAVNDVINDILARKDGPLPASVVIEQIAAAVARVELLETEDRDRTYDYLIEIWYLLGFRGATGLFGHGAAFTPPEGYGEPLPPGWVSPTHPRTIG
jgi:hypothetical protein